MPLLVSLLLKYAPQTENIAWIKWVSDHQAELHVGIAVLCVAVYMVVAPFRLYQRERTAKEAAESALKNQPVEQPRFALDVADPEARRELEKTKSELEKAQETIRALDPLQQHIASATATAEVFVKSDENDGTSSHTMGGGGSITFARGTEALLATAAMNATSRTQNNQKTIYLVFNSPIYGPLVGKPLTELGTAEYVQLEITAQLGALDVLGGTIIFTLNGSRRFEFPIPAQAIVERRIFVRDLYQMRSQLKPNP